MQTKTKQTIAMITGEQEVVEDPPKQTPVEQVANVLVDDWKTREERDKAYHNAGCRVCREGIDPGDSDLYAVKNRRTREFIHIIADSTEDAIAQLNWPPEDVQYTMGTVLHTSRKKMSAETKADLKERSKQKRLAKAATRARVVKEVVDKQSATCYSGDEDSSEIKRKEVGDMTLNSWVKEWMDGFIMSNDNGKRVMDPKALFGLAEVNKLDIKKYKAKFKAADAGRIRMTIGNMLKGAANRRHKLLQPGGKSTLVPSKLVKGQPTEDAHGVRLKKSA